MRLSFLLFFLANELNQLFAQCDTIEYSRILIHAQFLVDSGRFLEAKNNYEAARIYACGEKDVSFVEAKIDSLFVLVESSREAEKASRILAQSAKNRTDKMIDVYNMKLDADIRCQQKRFSEAKIIYKRILDTLSIMPLSTFYNSYEYILKLTIEKDLAETKVREMLKVKFDSLLICGDKFSNQKDSCYLAFEFYKGCLELSVDDLIAIEKLKSLELSMPSKQKEVIGIPLNFLLNNSAETNLIINRPSIALKRMRQIARYAPENISFIKDSLLRVYYLSKFRNARVHVIWQLTTKNFPMSATGSGNTLGVRYMQKSGFSFGYDFYIRNIYFNNNDYIREIESTLSLAVIEKELLKLKNRKWNSNQLSINCFASVGTGKTYFLIPEIGFPKIRCSLYLFDKIKKNTHDLNISPDGNFIFSNTNSGFSYEYNVTLDTFLMISSKTEYYNKHRYLNTFIGLNVFYRPLPRFARLITVLNVSYLTTPIFKGEEIDIKKDLVDSFSKKYLLPGNETASFISSYEESLAPQKIKITNNTQGWAKNFDIRIGIAYLF